MAATKTRRGRTAKATNVDELKVAADKLIDELVEGTPANALAFVERFALERARAQANGTFKLWSLSNRVYLQAQVARRNEQVRNLFAGHKQWEAMGRKVRSTREEVITCAAGECASFPCPHGTESTFVEKRVDAYKIQGSPFYTVKGEDPDTGEEIRQQRFGRAPIIDVYDWSQTYSTVDGYEEPDWEAPISSGDRATLNQLVRSSPVPVEFSDLGATNSHGRYDGEKIVIDETTPVGNQIVELSRQLAHHHLDHTTSDGQVDDTEGYSEHVIQRSEATLVGWVVGKALGLDDEDSSVTTQAAEYLHMWTKVNNDGEVMQLEGRKSRRKLLKSRVDVAIRAADKILEAYCDHAPETVTA